MLAVFLYGKKSLTSERTFTRIKKVNNRLQERSDFMGDTKEAILTTALQYLQAMVMKLFPSVRSQERLE